MNDNQISAVYNSVENNFKSGVHYHATGTGKSWIALQLILEYYQKNGKCNILWITESKSILIEQFNKEKIKEKGYQKIFEIYRIFNYALKKEKNWYDNINSFQYWNLSSLIIINRDYLTYHQNYKKIRAKIDLIIHDECHSIQNKSTQSFYEFVLENWNTTKCIGFSATPILQYKPFDTLLSSYTIYDAYKDNIILPPKIYCLKSDKSITLENIIDLYKTLSSTLHYKKTIIWCGLIQSTYEYSKIFKEHLDSEYKICIDVSSKQIEKQNEEIGIGNYEDFYDVKQKGILFCAAKHREGSDIPNLDSCIFMDYVEKRSSKTFVQCIGRVLRKDKDNKKEYGLIIDTKARSINNLIERMSDYFGLSEDKCPWVYHYNVKNDLIINELTLTKNPKYYNYIDDDNSKYEKKYSKEEIKDYFKRKMPLTKVYKDRLEKELDLIVQKNLGNYLIQACQILKMTKNIPHVTRGSCGSSLVCYLLGISNIDPVQYNISFARFLNEYRDNLPDIDFDFPHIFRDEIFLKLHLQWNNKIARISNHCYFHEKSALRQAIRNQNIHQFISKDNIHQFIKSLPKDIQQNIKKDYKDLLETFRGYSLHCGGIVYFHNGIPKEYLMNVQKGGIQQVNLNKHQVSDNKQFKIDILSSRGLTIVYEILGNNLEKIPKDDIKVYELLSSGDNIGIILAESPLIRKAFIKIKPTCIQDIAVVLSIIRPAAVEARDTYYNHGGLFKNMDYFIFDDDAIHIIQKHLNCSEDYADKLRRDYCKKKTIPITDKEVLSKLKYSKKYSFCKAHAFSYAELVYYLAFCKYYYPKQFWNGVLQHASSLYKKWVHLYEAHLQDVDIHQYITNKEDASIYAKNRKNKKLNEFKNNDVLMMKKLGYWNIQNRTFFNDCYFVNFYENKYCFKGLIASKKSYYSKGRLTKLVLFIGVQNNTYIEVIISKIYNYKNDSIGIKGEGTLNDLSYECHKYDFF